MIDNKNYVVIQGWMINELKLKGNELLIYAIIYGFSQSENQVYNGSLGYLAEWTNSTKQGVIKNLKSLLEKELIVKKDNYLNGVKFVEYSVSKFNGIKQSLMGGIKQSSPNNIDINNIEIKENNIKEKFIKPSLEEIKAYCQERNNGINPSSFYDFYESKNWMIGKNHMKDWKAAVRTWEQRSKSNKKVVETPSWYAQYKNELKEKSEQSANNKPKNENVDINELAKGLFGDE